MAREYQKLVDMFLQAAALFCVSRMPLAVSIFLTLLTKVFCSTLWILGIIHLIAVSDVSAPQYSKSLV